LSSLCSVPIQTFEVALKNIAIISKKENLMRLYFKHVIFGVLIRPKNAIEYIVNNSTPFSLTFLIIFSIFAGMGVLGINGLRIEKNLFIHDYVSVKTMKIFLFGLFFSLLYIFNKIIKTKANARDIFYVTLLTGISSMWVTLITIIAIILANNFDVIDTYVAGAPLMLVLLFIYHIYIVVQLLNTVQKVSMKKSVAVVVLTTLTLIFIVGVSKYYEKSQQNLVISIYQTLLNNTDNNAKKSTYYIDIAELYEDKKEYAQAIEYIFKALEITEDNETKSKYYYWIAEDYKKIDKIDEALKYAKKSLALTPEDEDSLEQVSELENQKLEMRE